MDTKKAATAVLDRKKPPAVPTTNPIQNKPSPQEESRQHLTEDLIHASEKRMQDALDKFKANESIRKEAEALNIDIAGRIRRLSQSAKTEDAFNRDVDIFVASAVSYIINKTRAVHRKEKQKKEKEAFEKKKKEKKAYGEETKSEESEKNEDKEPDTNEGEKKQNVENTPEIPVLPTPTTAPETQVQNPSHTEQSSDNTTIPTKETPTPEEITSATTPQSEDKVSQAVTIPQSRPIETFEQQASATESKSIDTNVAHQKDTQESVTPDNKQTTNPQAKQDTETTSADGTFSGTKPTRNNQLVPGNITPHSVAPPYSPKNPDKSITGPTRQLATKPGNTLPTDRTKSQQLPRKPASAINAILQNNKKLLPIRSTTLKNKTTNTKLQKTSTISPAVNRKTKVHNAIQRALQNNTNILNKIETKSSRTQTMFRGISKIGSILTNATAKTKNLPTPIKAVPLSRFHRVFIPPTSIEEDTTLEMPEENDRGSSVTGNPRIQTRTEYPGSPPDPGYENYSTRKYFDDPSEQDDDEDGGGGGDGNSKRNKRRKRQIPGAAKTAAKRVAQQLAKSLFQALMRNPYFWAGVIIILIFIMIITIFISIGEQQALENAKNKDAPELTLDKTGPVKAIKGQNMEYTITANYPADAEDLTITDRIPVGVKYISSVPPGTYNATARTVTWNARQLNIPLANPVSMVVKVVLQAETDNISAVNIATGEVVPGDGSLLNVTKSGPPTATAGQNAVYTITADYQGTAEDITIIDKLPVGVTYVSSNPAGIHNATARTVTWNAKALKMTLGNPSKISVTVTLRIDANNIALVNEATATVKAAMGQLNVPPSNNDCHGVYKNWMDQLKRIGKSNYGDPTCELVKQDPNGRWIIDKDKMLEGFKTIMPAKEAEGTWTCIIPIESAYNSNAWNPKSTSTARGTSGAYGNFQMNEAKFSNAGQPEDIGDVAWRQQAFNAFTWKNKYNNGKWGGYWPQMYNGCLNKFGL